MPVITPNIPEGLIELMKVFAKCVLKEKPDNIFEFSVVHFENLLQERDGDLNKGYERFAASEKYLEGREKCLMSQIIRRNKKGKPDPIKIPPIDGTEVVPISETLSPQSLHHKFRPRKLSSRKASEVLLSIKEEDEGHNATEELVLQHGKLTAARRIQRAYKSYRKRKAEKENGAAFVIQRTLKKLFGKKLESDKALKTDRESTCSNIQNDSGVESDVPKDEAEGEDANQKESNVGAKKYIETGLTINPITTQQVPSFTEVESQRSTNLEFDNVEKPAVENLDDADTVVQKEKAVENENSVHMGSNIGSSPSKQVEVEQTHLNDQSGHVDAIAEIVPIIDANSQSDQNHITGEVINAEILKDIGEAVKTDASEAGKSILEREGRFILNDTNNIGSVVSDVHHDKGDDIEIVNKTNGFPEAILEEVARNGSKNDISKETIELVKTPRETPDFEKNSEETNNSDKSDDNAKIGNQFRNEEESHNLDNSGAEHEENEVSASSVAGNNDISNDTEKDQSQLNLTESRDENKKGSLDNNHEGTEVQLIENSEGQSEHVNNMVSDHHINGTDNGNEDNKDNKNLLSTEGADLAIPKSVWYVGSVPIITTKSAEEISETNSLERIITEKRGYNGNNGDQENHNITIENNSGLQEFEKENEISEDIGTENNVVEKDVTETQDKDKYRNEYTEDGETHKYSNILETTEGSIENPEKKGETFEEADKIINKGTTIETEIGKVLEEELNIPKEEEEDMINNNEYDIAEEKSEGRNNIVKTEKTAYSDADPSDINEEAASVDESKNDNNSNYHNAISYNNEENVNAEANNSDEKNKDNSQEDTSSEKESKHSGETKPLLSTSDVINDVEFDGKNEASNALSDESGVNNEDENGINRTEIIEDDIIKVVIPPRYESPTKIITTFGVETKPTEDNNDSEISQDKMITKELLQHANVKDTDVILKDEQLSTDQSVQNEEIDTSLPNNNQQIHIENKNYTEIFDVERKTDQSLLSIKASASENNEDMVNHENGTITTSKVTEVTNEDEEKAMELQRTSSVKRDSTIEIKEAGKEGIIEALELVNVEPNANEKELNTNASVDKNRSEPSDEILGNHRSNFKDEKQQKQKEERAFEGFILEPAFKDNDGSNTGNNPEQDALSEGSKESTKAVMTNVEQEINSTHDIEQDVEEVKISLPEDIRQKDEDKAFEATQKQEKETEVWDEGPHSSLSKEDNKSSKQSEERKESDPSAKQHKKENQHDKSNGSDGDNKCTMENDNTKTEDAKSNIATRVDHNTIQKQEESVEEKQINLQKDEETNPEEKSKTLQDLENENNLESRDTVGGQKPKTPCLGNAGNNEDKISGETNINEQNKKQEDKDSLKQELDDVNSNKKDSEENGNGKEKNNQNDNKSDDNDQNIANVSVEEIRTIEKTVAIPYETNLKSENNRELNENKNVQNEAGNDVEGTKFCQEIVEHTEVIENACKSNEKYEQNADGNYGTKDSGNENKTTLGLEQTPEETEVVEELLNTAKTTTHLEQTPEETDIVRESLQTPKLTSGLEETKIVEEPLKTPKTAFDLEQTQEETKIVEEPLKTTKTTSDSEKTEIVEEPSKTTKATPNLEQTVEERETVEEPLKTTIATPDLEQAIEETKIVEEPLKTPKTTSDSEKTEIVKEPSKTTKATLHLGQTLEETKTLEEPLNSTKTTTDLEQTTEETKIVEKPLKTPKTTSDSEKTEIVKEPSKTTKTTPDLENTVEKTEIVEEPLKTTPATPDLEQTTEETKIVEEPLKTPKTTSDSEKTEIVKEPSETTKTTPDLENTVENIEIVEEPLKTTQATPDLEQTTEETEIVEEPLKTPKTTSDLEKREIVEEPLKTTKATLHLGQTLEETKTFEEPLNSTKTTTDLEQTTEETESVEEPLKTPKTTSHSEKTEIVEESLKTTKTTPDLENTVEKTEIVEEPVKTIEATPDLEQTTEETKIVEEPLKTPKTTSDLEKTEIVEEPLKTTKTTPDLEETLKESNVDEEPLKTQKTTSDLETTESVNEPLKTTKKSLLKDIRNAEEVKKNIEEKEHNDESKRVKEKNENEDQTKFNKNTNYSSDTSQAHTKNTMNEKEENIEVQKNMGHIAGLGNSEAAQHLDKKSTELKCSKPEELPAGEINTNLEDVKVSRKTSELVSSNAGKHKSITHLDKDNMNAKEMCGNEQLQVLDGESKNCKQDQENDNKIQENRQNDSTVQLNKTYTISNNKSKDTLGDNAMFKQKTSAALKDQLNETPAENDFHSQKSTEKLQVKEMEGAVHEEPIMKQILSHTSASEVHSAHLSDAETTRAESRSTINDELSEIENLDISTYGEDSLEAMYYSLRKNEIMLDRMQKRASERKSASKEREPLEKLDLRQVKSMSEMNGSTSVSSDDDVIIKRVERNNINQFISPISVSAQNAEKLLDSMHQIQPSSVKPPSPKEEDRVVRPACRMYSPSIRMKSRIPTPIKDYPKSVSFETPIAVAQRKSQIFMQRLHDDSKSSETLDSVLNQKETSDTIRQKMLAYSVSEADSDNCEATEKINVTHDDFNVSTALETASTDTDSTIVSAATKIQAGARGFLTRRRLRRASEGALPQQSESKASFGNDAIGESLEDLVEQNAASKIQKSYRKYLGSKQYKSESSKLSPETSSSSKSSDGSKPVGITQVKIGQKRDRDDNDDGAEKTDDIDDGYHGAYFEGLNLAERRMTLQRGDAVQKYSTPEEENGSLANGRQSSEAGDSKPTTSPKQRKPVNDTWRYFGLRQRTMPVQIETDILRVVPKHLRKRIKSADAHNKRRQVMQ